mgnify:CR=1 FL=1
MRAYLRDAFLLGLLGVTPLMAPSEAIGSQIVLLSQQGTVDSDGDGTPDILDNAPGVANNQADADADVRHAVEAPSKAAHEIHDRVEERDLLPERRQHADRIEAPAEKGEGSDDQHRHELELLEAVNQGRSEPVTRNTLQTQLTRLEAKGWIVRDDSSRSHAYEPAVPEQRGRTSVLAELKQRFFGGRRLLILLHRLLGPIGRCHEGADFLVTNRSISVDIGGSAWIVEEFIDGDKLTLELFAANRDDLLIGRFYQGIQERINGIGTKLLFVTLELNKLEDARAALKEIVGVEVRSLKPFVGDIDPAAPQPAQVEPWVAAALSQNLALQARAMATEIASATGDQLRAA